MSIAILEIEEALLTRGFDGSDIAWFIANDPLERGRYSHSLSINRNDTAVSVAAR
jgi:hypothetical protein